MILISSSVSFLQPRSFREAITPTVLPRLPRSYSRLGARLRNLVFPFSVPNPVGLYEDIETLHFVPVGAPAYVDDKRRRVPDEYAGVSLMVNDEDADQSRFEFLSGQRWISTYKASAPTGQPKEQRYAPQNAISLNGSTQHMLPGSVDLALDPEPYRISRTAS